MDYIFAIIMICVGIGIGWYGYKKASDKTLDVEYMQTSSMKDALEVFESMADSDPSYRHYVELKGSVFGNETLKAPFSERDSIYYENACYSVTQETSTYRDKNGNVRTSTRKVETLLSNEKSPVNIYVEDNTSSTRIYLDMQSFDTSEVDLSSVCDRFESKGSPWISRYGNRFSSHVGSNFLGYRLKEGILVNNQPLYMLGELYKMGDVICLGKAQLGNKTSVISVKSEGQLVNEAKKQKIMSLVAGGVVVLIAIISMFS